MAQRITFGATQADLIRVDVEKEVERLIRLYPESPLAYWVAALGLRALGSPAATDRLEEAHARLSRGRPLR